MGIRIKPSLIILLLLPLLFSLFFLMFSSKKPVVIFPGSGETPFAPWQYSNPQKSHIKNFVVKDESITIEFIHHQSGSFAGVGFNLADFPDYFDISGFSHIRLNLTTGNVKNCSVTLKLFADGITDINIPSSYRHMGINIPVLAATADYNLSLDRLTDAAWWIRDYNSLRRNLGRRSYKKACFLLIESTAGENPPPGNSRLRINRITLIKSNLWNILIVGLCSIIYYILLAVILFKYGRLNTAGQNRQMITRKKLQVESYRDMDIRKITTYIRSHYSEPDLSLGKMSSALGLSTNRVSFLIKEKFETTFKQQLNKLRMAEAARLLKETDLLIIDIAFAVGYNDRSYFYKVFLKSNGLSPREYRKQNT